MKNRSFFIRAAVLALTLVMICAVTGCGQEFDAGDYVKAMIDASYKGDYSAYTKQNIGSRDEGRKMHENNVKALVDSFSSMFGSDLDDQELEDLGKAMESLCGAVKYDIGNVIELDGKYTVDVTASPLQFSTVLEDEEFNKEAEETVKGAMKDDPNIGDKELMAALTGLLIDRFNEIASDPQYGKEKTVKVEVSKNDSGAYEIDSESWKKLDRALIQ